MNKINEVWLFTDFKVPIPSKIKIIKNLNVSDVVLGVGKPPYGQITFSNNSIITCSNALAEAGINVHLMSWVSRRTEEHIEYAYNLLKSFTNIIDCKSIMLDLEKDWIVGQYSLDRAIDMTKDLVDKIQCQFGVTSYSLLPSSVIPILDICDYVIPQAYSVWKPSNTKHWTHSDLTIPGDMQEISCSVWSKHINKEKIVMGLGCYWLLRPNVISEYENLKICIDKVKELEIDKVAYWSLKHLVKNTGYNQVRRRFISTLKASNIDFSEVQWLLNKLDFDIGDSGVNEDGVDGIWGPKSKAALTYFQKQSRNKVCEIPKLFDVLHLLSLYIKIHHDNK